MLQLITFIVVAVTLLAFITLFIKLQRTGAVFRHDKEFQGYNIIIILTSCCKMQDDA
jgi:hypothetical protein